MNAERRPPWGHPSWVPFLLHLLTAPLGKWMPTMKLYHFSEPQDYRFARAGRLGTWAPDPAWTCPECGLHNQERVYPLILEWLSGSDQVGDFTWPGLDDELVVTQRVREAFEGAFRGVEFRDFEMSQPPKLKRPEQTTRRTKPRVWLPYEGPPLWDMQATAWCGLIHERSGVRLEKVCSTCDRPQYSWPEDAEHFMVLDPATWGGEDIFQIRECPRWIFCTERVKELVEANGFTNAGFALDGEIPGSARTGLWPTLAAGPALNWPPKELGPGSIASSERLPRQERLPAEKPAKAPLVLKEGRTIRAEDLPEEWSDFAALDVDFPPLPDDQTRRYPEFEEELVEYMQLEGEEIDRDSLKFLRSARLNEWSYWIWEVELPEGDKGYATAALGNNQQRLSYDQDWNGLTPEQFLLADHFDCL